MYNHQQMYKAMFESKHFVPFRGELIFAGGSSLSLVDSIPAQNKRMQGIPLSVKVMFSPFVLHWYCST